MTNITLSISDDLARQAQSAGLLRSEAIEQLLREAMKKRQVDRLFATMDKLAALEPRLTEEEIDAEIAAARAERARRR
ncbi:MAG TPA: type II toxin-antitoxin system CcdA family antitoxin [Polyangiaceae bacterium]